MTSSKQALIIGFMLILCTTQSGCALFALPGQLIGGIFNLAGQALQVANGLPKPPPWMFF